MDCKAVESHSVSVRRSFEYARKIFPVHVVVKDFCKTFCIGHANFQGNGETTQSYAYKIEALVYLLLKFLHLLVMLVGGKLFQTKVSIERCAAFWRLLSENLNACRSRLWLLLSSLDRAVPTP